MPRIIPLPIFQHQADATIVQANPVSTTLYEWSSDGTQANKLGALKNVRIISITASVTSTVQSDPLEIVVTIDGQTLIFIQGNPASTTKYYPIWNQENTPATQECTTRQIAFDARNFFLEGRSVKVEARRTGGTVSSLDVRVKWAKIP